jgi:hypothetical protein
MIYPIKAVSLLGKLFFSYAGSVFMLGGSKKLITFDELPILPARLRAVVNLSQIRYARRYIKLPFESLRQPGSGYELAYQLLGVNFPLVCTLQLVSAMTAVTRYAPIAFIQFFLKYLETDPQRKNTSWGWFHVTGIFAGHFILVLCEIAPLLCVRWSSQKTSCSYWSALVIVHEQLEDEPQPPAEYAFVYENARQEGCPF